MAEPDRLLDETEGPEGMTTHADPGLATWSGHAAGRPGVTSRDKARR